MILSLNGEVQLGHLSDSRVRTGGDPKNSIYRLYLVPDGALSKLISSNLSIVINVFMQSAVLSLPWDFVLWETGFQIHMSRWSL